MSDSFYVRDYGASVASGVGTGTLLEMLHAKSNCNRPSNCGSLRGIYILTYFSEFTFWLGLQRDFTIFELTITWLFYSLLQGA